MGVSEFGALTREFYIAEIWTWENYGSKQAWRLKGGGDITRFYCISMHGEKFYQLHT